MPIKVKIRFVSSEAFLLAVLRIAFDWEKATLCEIHAIFAVEILCPDLRNHPPRVPRFEQQLYVYLQPQFLRPDLSYNFESRAPLISRVWRYFGPF